MIFNPKFLRPLRVFWVGIRGLFFKPQSDDAPDGWGKPFKDGDGNPINPPLGTIGGTDVYVNTKQKSGSPISIARGKPGLPYPEDTFDWRGLDLDGSLSQPYLHFKGPKTRYFPIHFVATPSLLSDEQTQNFYDTFFYYKGREIPGPGPTIRGGCIYDQAGTAYFIVITGTDIQTSPGVTLWKRPILNPDDLPWAEIDTLLDPDYLAFTRTPSFKWDVPWHFNASGNKACQLKSAKNATDPSSLGTCQYVISFDLNSGFYTKTQEDIPVTITSTKTVISTFPGSDPPSCPCVWEASGSITGGKIHWAIDFEYPGDTLVKWGQLSQSESSLHNYNQSTGENSRTQSGSRTLFLTGSTGQKTYTYDYIDLDWPAILERLTADDELYVYGADLRYRVIGLGVVQTLQKNFDIRTDCNVDNCPGTGVGSIIPAPGTFYGNVLSWGPAEWFFYGSLSLSCSGFLEKEFTMRVVTFLPDTVQEDVYVESGRAAASSFNTGGPLNPPRCGKTLVHIMFHDEFSIGTLTGPGFDDPDDAGETITVQYSTFGLFSGGGTHQYLNGATGGSVAVDRANKNFYSYETLDSPGPGFIAGVALVEGRPRHGSDRPGYSQGFDYEYQDVDVDTLVGTTGTRKHYHPIQST